MSSKNALLKIIFGGIIFLFGLAFAYFTASYLERGEFFDYWLALGIAAIAYVTIGVLVSNIASISLGFLFASDILLLHVLSEQYQIIPAAWKMLLVAVMLAILYLFVWKKLGDSSSHPDVAEQVMQ